MRETKMTKKYLAIATVVFLIITTLTSCGGKDKVTETAASGLPTVTANAGEAPTISAPVGNPPVTLQTQDIIVGSGTEVVATSVLTVHYTLMTWSNGAIVESSWTNGQPATFPLANVIPGWQQGLLGAKVGGRRLLVIPADLGYGPNGSGPIGPNETLIFAVDIVGVA